MTKFKKQKAFIIIIALMVSILQPIFNNQIALADDITVFSETFKKTGYMNFKNYPDWGFSEKKTGIPSVTIGAVALEDGTKCLQMLDTQVGRVLSFTRKMDTKTDADVNTEVDFDIMGGKIGESQRASVYALDSTEKKVSFKVILDKGTINVLDGEKEIPLVQAAQYNPDSWYKIKMNLNMKTKKYDVFVNGSTTAVAQNISFVDADAMGDTSKCEEFQLFRIQTNGVENEEMKPFSITNIKVLLTGEKVNRVSGVDVPVDYEANIVHGDYEKAIKSSQNLYDNRSVTLRQMENLDRAPVALKAQDEGIFISWRLLGTDSENISFDIYRDGSEINLSPINGATNYVDKSGEIDSKYVIKTVLNNEVTEETKEFSPLSNQYLEVPVGAKDGYNLGKVSVGDLDGDGQYELVIQRIPKAFSVEEIPTITKFPLYQAYKLDGTLLWTIDLGPNFVEAIDFNFCVYDLDGDGKAEFAIRTSEGTTDGTGVTIGDVNGDGKTDYRYSFVFNSNRQYLTEGPEFVSVFDGMTGKEMARTDYIERGDLSQWGGNSPIESAHRASHAMLTPAYLDGKTPSLIMTRGCWNTDKIRAVKYKDGKITKEWDFDSLEYAKNTGIDYSGQGNHQVEVADVDYDGKDEIVWGSAVYDNDGKPMYKSDEYGHGDAMHVGKFMPNTPDLFYVASVHEGAVKNGLQLREARTGETLLGYPNKGDTGRGSIADIDPTIDGPVIWAADIGPFAYDKGKWSVWKGLSLDMDFTAANSMPMNFFIWWDGDLLREFADHTTISKYNSTTHKIDTLLTANDCYSMNGTKKTPALQADILGDWREEYVLPTNNMDAYRIYTTNIPTDNRIYTLMQDPTYRLGVAWQNNHYAQPPHTGFFLAHQATTIPVPEIYVVKDGKEVSNPDLEGKAVNTAKYTILKPNKIGEAQPVEKDVQDNRVSLQIDNNKAVVNGKTTNIDEKNQDVKPIMKDDRTLVPVRFIAEAFNATVDWDEATSTVTIKSSDSKEIKMTLGSKSYTVNGEVKDLDVEAQSINGRTMLPLRAVLESLDKSVVWDQDNKLIIISNTKESLEASQIEGILKNLK